MFKTLFILGLLLCAPKDTIGLRCFSNVNNPSGPADLVECPPLHGNGVKVCTVWRMEDDITHKRCAETSNFSPGCEEKPEGYYCECNEDG